MSPTEIIKLRAFGRQLSAAFQSTPGLALIDDFDGTDERMGDQIVKFQAMGLMTNCIIDTIKRAAPSDDDNLEDLQTVALKARDLCTSFYADLLLERQHIIEGRCLKTDDGLVDLFDTLLNEVSAFSNGLNSLVWIIGEHIAEADITLPGSFSTADELFDAMGV